MKDALEDPRLINIGFGNIVAASRIIAIVAPDSAPIKRIFQEARDKGALIDATYGRRTRAVVITDSGHVLLSAVQPETVAHRGDIRRRGARPAGQQHGRVGGHHVRDHKGEEADPNQHANHRDEPAEDKGKHSSPLARGEYRLAPLLPPSYVVAQEPRYML